MELSISDFHGAPVVLAFANDWAKVADSAADLDVIRAELRGLGAALVVLSPAGIWSFRPDDDLERFRARDDEVALEIARLAGLYGVPRGDDGLPVPTLLVLDGKGDLRFSHATAVRGNAAGPTLAEALANAGRALAARAPSDVVLSRREWVVASLAASFAIFVLPGCAGRQGADANHPPPGLTAGTASTDGEMDLVLSVNGANQNVRIDPRVSLLDALRERLGLTGTKKGCDHGQCGACTVLLDGRRICSCLTLAVMAQKKKITTIEGLAPAEGDRLHPMQAAFASQDALQCGYCTPGQIMSAVGLVAEGNADTDDEVREEMSGNLCRCGAYPNIVAAVQLARKGA